MTGWELNDELKIRGLSCVDLSKKTGLPVQKIRAWRKGGGIPFDAAIKIRTALGISKRSDNCLMYTVKTPYGVRFGPKGVRK